MATARVLPVPYVSIVTEFSFDHRRSVHPIVCCAGGGVVLERPLHAFAHVAVGPWQVLLRQ
jgi:hypothetical protein